MRAVTLSSLLVACLAAGPIHAGEENTPMTQRATGSFEVTIDPMHQEMLDASRCRMWPRCAVSRRGAVLWIEGRWRGIHWGAWVVPSCIVAGNTASTGIGGAIISTAAGEIVDLVDTWITANSSEGATVHVPRLVLTRSTVSDNVSTAYAPAIAIYGSSVLVNSTVSGHTTPAFTGGVLIMGEETTIASCTLAGNDGSELHIGDNATVEMSNTLIAGNCSGMVAPGSIGGNLESPGATCGLDPGDDLDGVADPGLSALGFHGGVAPVFLPLAGSAAVDAAVAGYNCNLFDQRELSRPRDGDGDGTAGCDIGAVELAGPGELFTETFECGFLTPGSEHVAQ
jgi:hypothetical protein